MKRPIVVFAFIWTAGTYLVLVEEQRWLLLSISLLLIIALIFPNSMMLSRRACLLSILLLMLSIGYNGWFDSQNETSLSNKIIPSLAESKVDLWGEIISPVKVDGDRVSFIVMGRRVAPAIEKLEEKVDEKVDEEANLKVGKALNESSEKLQLSIRLTTKSEQSVAQTWQRGDYIVLTGTLQKPNGARNFEMFDYQKYLRLQHIHWIVQVKGLQQVKVSAPDRWSLLSVLRWNDGIRLQLGSKVDSIFSEPHSGFMKSLLIGLRDDVDPEQFQQFSQIGMTHIMAISGLHVAIFIAGCMWIMKSIGLTRETNLLITLFLIPLYVILTGAAPSVIRAGFMAIIALYALRRNILKDGLHIISFVAVAMLIWNPYYLFNISFQLSFIVTIGLIVGVPIMSKILPFQSNFLKSAISVTTVAQIVSFPLSIYYFNQFSLLSWLANFFLVPLVSICILPLGMIALLLGMIYEPVGLWISFLIEYMNSALFFIIEYFNGIEIFLLIWPSPSIMWILVFYFLSYVLLWSLTKGISYKGNLQRLLPLCLSIMGLMLLLGYGYHPEHLNQTGKVQFLDVGQGDSILIRTPSNQTILIDGGGTLTFRKPGEDWKNRQDPYEVGKDLLVPLLKKRGVHQIDYLVLSHGDMDHIGGLQAVLDSIPVRKIFFNGTLRDSPNVTKLFETAIQNHIPLYTVHENKQLRVDQNTIITFIHPQETSQLEHVEKQNNYSVVCLLQMYDSSFLFTGDIHVQAELDIIERLEGLKRWGHIDVMKAAHHGSKTSTSEAWLEYWKPKATVMSVGVYNFYGHPNPQVVNRLQDFKSKVYRTDLHGEVQMEVSKDKLKVRTVFHSL